MIVPDKLAASTVPVTLKLVKPVRFVMFAFVALTVPIAAVPVTVRLFKVPIDVIFG